MKTRISVRLDKRDQIQSIFNYNNCEKKINIYNVWNKNSEGKICIYLDSGYFGWDFEESAQKSSTIISYQQFCQEYLHQSIEVEIY